MKKLTPPRAILFDWDNTLVNTWPLIHSALNMTLRHMDHPEWTYERVRSEVKQSMRDSFPGMFGDTWEDAATHYRKSYRSIHLDQLEPLPDVEAMLGAIARPDVFVGLVSNKQGDTLRMEVEKLGWQHYFNVAVGASDAARDKPHADPVLLALKDSGITPAANVWFVGDTSIDIEVANATGCTPILYGDCTEDWINEGTHPYAAHVLDHSGLRELIVVSSAA
jgi:phosphoglycolate phosphatase